MNDTNEIMALSDPQTIALWGDPLSGTEWPEPILWVEVRGTVTSEWFDGPAPTISVCATRELTDDESQRFEDLLVELWEDAGLEPTAHVIGWSYEGEDY